MKVRQHARSLRQRIAQLPRPMRRRLNGIVRNWNARHAGRMITVNMKVVGAPPGTAGGGAISFTMRPIDVLGAVLLVRTGRAPRDWLVRA